MSYLQFYLFYTRLTILKSTKMILQYYTINSKIRIYNNYILYNFYFYNYFNRAVIYIPTTCVFYTR